MTTHLTIEEVDTLQQEVELPRMEVGNPKFILGVIMVMAALIGMWGVLCLVGGLGNSDTLQGLARGFMTASLGM